jgi:hypothetical protein
LILSDFGRVFAKAASLIVDTAAVLDQHLDEGRTKR